LPFFIARKDKEMSETEMAKTEKEYQIESDARILVDAEIIKRDQKRHKAAVAQIKKENAARKSAVKS